jgi:hypothetical protein
LAAARELAALAQRAALMPGRLDQQPPCVRGVLPVLVMAPWLRRSPLDDSLGTRARKRAQRERPEAAPSAQLHHQGQRRQRRDAAQADQPCDALGERRRGRRLADRQVERARRVLACTTAP